MGKNRGNGSEKRSALAVHHTATDEAAWDGPANEARLRNDGDEAYYRKAYAWLDPDGDPDTKAAYKFIHHFVDEDGNIGAASTRGCIAGIGVLNGGRGGADIPDGDRQGVYNHLAAHLQDADLEPPDLRYFDSPEIERRYFTREVRMVEGENGQRKIVGYGAVFSSMSEELWGFREIIEPGAFDGVMDDDVRSLFNHDPNLILGRTNSGTLVIEVDDVGLRYEVDPPDSEYARALVTSIERGDVDQSSFGFQVAEETWEKPKLYDELPTRRIHKFARLYDLGPVTFAAYPETGVSMRALEHAKSLTGGATGEESEAGPAGRLDLLRKKLELVERE